MVADLRDILGVERMEERKIDGCFWSSYRDRNRMMLIRRQVLSLASQRSTIGR